MPLNNSAADFLARHLETANILYADGHVKAQKLQSLIASGTVNIAGYGNFTTAKYFTNADD